MRPRQPLGQLGIALVGDRDRRAGLGDQEVGAGDADVGREIALAQDPPRASATSSAASSTPRPAVMLREQVAISSLVMWTAGPTMWLGGWPASWMMYSPRSVSTGCDAVRLEVAR